jgi:hypothetical protein
VRLLEVPSAAALKARIVSRGRSIRARVGFDRSGSAIHQSVFDLRVSVYDTY